MVTVYFDSTSECGDRLYLMKDIKGSILSGVFKSCSGVTYCTLTSWSLRPISLGMFILNVVYVIVMLIIVLSLCV